MSKLIKSGGLYFLAGVLFIIAALTQATSGNLFVVALLWICALVFIMLGVWQLKKNGPTF